MNKTRNLRALSAILAVLLFMTCFPILTFADDRFAITYEGETVSQVEFYKNEKLEVWVENTPRDYSTQWQILIPDTDIWVDIQGQTEASIKLSYAVLGSLMKDDSAWVRCVARDGGEEVQTEALCATVLEVVEMPVQTVTEPEEYPAEEWETEPEEYPAEEWETEYEEYPTEEWETEPEEYPAEEWETEPEEYPAEEWETEPEEYPAEEWETEPEEYPAEEWETEPEEYPAEEWETEPLEIHREDAQPMPFALAGEDEPETNQEGEVGDLVSITIQYIYRDYNDDPVEGFDWPPRVANIPYGNDYTTTVQIKTIPGYTAQLEATEDAVTLGADGKTVIFDLKNVTESKTYTMVYRTIKVPYHVRRFLQNVNNDLYTEDTQFIDQEFEGYPGDLPDTQAIYRENDYPGFTALFYQPDTVAADGSTVFEVYYDRNYYLINVDLQGGYGAQPVYARYETTYRIAEPTKPGFTFAGWKLVEGGTTDRPVGTVIEELTGTVPDRNQKYQAQWTQGGTTYSKVYWILEEDGSKTFIGSNIEQAQSGALVSGENDLTNAMTCGQENHIHTTDCAAFPLSCDHTHTQDCYKLSDQNPPSETEQALIRMLEGGEPEEGCMYTLDYDGKTQYKIFLGTHWNGWWQPQGEYQAMLGDMLGEMTITYEGNEYTVRKYHAKFSNCTEGHVHTLGCHCGKHTHSDACRFSESKYLEYVESKTFEKDDGTEVTVSTDKNVVVKGDGSTTVNAYYQRKLYYIKFYYARTRVTETDDGEIVESNPQISTNNYNWSQNNADLAGSFYTDASVPDVKDTLSNAIEEQSEIKASGEYKYKYYYLLLKARYQDDISAIWPADDLDNAGKYTFVSWGTEDGTLFNEDEKLNGGNRNIKGPYSVMDETLIKNNSTYDENIGAWEAQSMVGYWNESKNLRNWTYNIYFKALTDANGVVQNPENKQIEVRPTGKNNVDETYLLETSFSDIFSDKDNLANKQTPINYVGYKYITRDGTEWTGSDGKYYGNLNLFYEANMHKLYYQNIDRFMSGGGGADVPYGKALGVYGSYFSKEVMERDYYPTVLEENAYEFGGWYTSPDCLPGSEMNWNGTMPDADITVYAKWVPKTYDVKFYLDYEKYQAGTPVYYQVQNSEHGKTMLNPPDVPIHQDTDYTFVRWVYEDEAGNKYSFEPTQMPVRQDMELYAEWRTNEVSEYTAYFAKGVEQADGTITMVRGEDGKPIYLTKAPLTGYAVVGTTKTIQAKPLDELNNIPAGEENQLWLPQTSSHSILMQSDGEKNVFTFLYITKAAANYKVLYLDKETNQPVHDETTGTTNNAEETIWFKYVEGYIPDALYKQMVLSADDNQNVLIFYYTKDEAEEDEPDNALYQINHLIQDVDGKTFTSYKTETGTGAVGSPVTATPMTISGFTFKEESFTIDGVTYQSQLTGTITSGADDGANKALELKLYYLRDTTSYTVHYRDQESDTDLQAPVTRTDVFVGAVVEETAPEFAGYDLISNETQTLTVSSTASLNQITFWYRPKEHQVDYLAVCSDPYAENFGKLERNQDLGTQISGSRAYAMSGFYFDGWYQKNGSEELSLITKNEAFDPDDFNLITDDEYEYTFYARFVPITLTITQTGMAEENRSAIYEVVNSGGQTVARVSITGNSSVTLTQIPLGVYTIREISDDWTWTYEATEATTVTVTAGDNETVRSHTPKAVDWHNGENAG